MLPAQVRVPSVLFIGHRHSVQRFLRPVSHPADADLESTGLGLVGALPPSVSDRGVIARTAIRSTEPVVASNGARWDSAGSFRVLADPSDSVGLDGQNICVASGINVWGHVIGTCEIPHGFYNGIDNFDWHGPATSAGGVLQANSQFMSVSDDNWIGGDINSQGIPTAPISCHRPVRSFSCAGTTA